MNLNRRLVTFITILTIALLMIPSVPVAQAASTPRVGPPVTAVTNGETELRTGIVTLITGDVLTVTELEDGRYAISTVSDRPVQVISTGEATYVIPADIERIGGIIDIDLFNINYLMEYGYCDAEMTGIPIIIVYSENPGRDYADINTVPGLQKKTAFETVSASSAIVSKEDADKFAEAVFYTDGGLEGVRRILLDRKVRLSLDTSVPGIGAPHAWDLGYNGTGIKVAVLDTGIWKDHPALAGKVIAERSFTTDPHEDYISPSDYHGHGTHVAGIIASQDPTYRGVAPGASLINAKVMNRHGSGMWSWIFAGWEWAAEQGADIFSMSFGGSPTDGFDLVSTMLNAMVDEHGIVAVASAGNMGGYRTILTPAAADNAIAVGATGRPGALRLSVVEPVEKYLSPVLLIESPIPPDEGIIKPIVYAGLGCAAADFEGIGVEGKIALIRRGVCTFRVKVMNAYEAGAVAAIIFNHSPGNFLGTLVTPTPIPAVSISLEEGTYLLDLLEEYGTGNVTVDLRWDLKAVEMADFSSRGPRLGNEAVKPAIVAPGVAIRSTVPLGDCALCDPTGWRSESGTSMSAPFVSGVAALLLQKNPEWTWRQVRDAMMSTARTGVSDPFIHPKPVADIYTQGSGIVAADRAIEAQVFFEPAVISFGVITRPWTIQEGTFKIVNHGDESVTLDLTVDKMHDIRGNLHDIVSIDKTSVTIPAGSYETVKVTIDVPSDKCPVGIPLGGRIHAKNAATGEEIHGIFGVYKDLKYDLRVRIIRPDGEPWAFAMFHVFNAYDPAGLVAFNVPTNATGEAVVRVPPATYNLISGEAGSAVWPNQPVYWMKAIEVLVDKEVLVTLDAREARPIELTMHEPTVPAQSESWVVWTYPVPGSIGFGWLGGSVRMPGYATPVPETTEGQINMANRFLEIPGTSPADLSVQRATRVYDLYYTMVGRIETPIEYVVDEAALEKLAMVEAKHYSDRDTRVGQYYRFVFPTQFDLGIAMGIHQTYEQPVTRREYYSPEVAEFSQSVIPEADMRHFAWIRFGEPYRVYNTGERLARSWLEYPMKPYTLSATRTGNLMGIGGLPVTDRSINSPSFGEFGYTFDMEVYRDDVLIFTGWDFYSWTGTVPPEEATYTIKLHYKNIPRVCIFCEGVFEPYWSSMSTESNTTIRFRSGFVAAEPLPIINLRYRVPGLNMYNIREVPPPRPRIDITTEHLQGLRVPTVRFWRSYDDGATWRRLHVQRGRGLWTVDLDHRRIPRDGAYVSIKTEAIDERGNSIEQVIMRAFYIEPTLP